MKKQQFAMAALAVAMLPGCRPGSGCGEIAAEPAPAEALRQSEDPSCRGDRLSGAWKMEQTPDGIDANLVFLSGGGLGGFTGVNSFFGTFSTADGMLTMTVTGMTRAAGSPQAMEFELNFLEILATVNGFAADGEELLLLNDGAMLAAFQRMPPK